MDHEIILYQSNELPEHIEVKLEDDTVWLSQHVKVPIHGQKISTKAHHWLYMTWANVLI